MTDDPRGGASAPAQPTNVGAIGVIFDAARDIDLSDGVQLPEVLDVLQRLVLEYGLSRAVMTDERRAGISRDVHLAFRRADLTHRRDMGPAAEVIAEGGDAAAEARAGWDITKEGEGDDDEDE